MKCSKCKNKAVFLSPNYCKEHFIEYFEKKAIKTISNCRLFDKKDRIAVASSGGKDSVALLYVLKKYGYDIEAIAIDEGIKGYRDKTIKDLKKFCNEQDIRLSIYSFKEEFGMNLDKMIKKHKQKPCTICGIFRRYLLNEKSKCFDALATGHNLDDEVQSVMMNLFRNTLEANARLGPKTGLVKDKRFVQRVKPFYMLTEKETKTYAFLKGFDVMFTECPYVPLSFRAGVRDFLNEQEQAVPGSKVNVINSFLKMLPDMKKRFATDERIKACRRCRAPSQKELCKACLLLEELKL